MSEAALLAARWVLRAVGLYLALGLGFALAFVIGGVQRIDPRAMGAGLGFRLAILPGSAVFWPLLLRRWLTGRPPPEEKSSHRRRSNENRGAS